MAVTGGDTNGTRMASLVSGGAANLVESRHYGGKVRAFNEVVALASQAKSKTIGVAFLPKGSVPLYGGIITDTSLGTATISIGDTTDVDQYRADAVLTATNAWEWYGRPGVSPGVGVEITADQEVLITNSATAALPASGTLRNVMVYLSPN